jgi:hypothetical protein
VYNKIIYNSNFFKTFKLKNIYLNFYNFNFKKISLSVRILIFLIILTNMFNQFNYFKCDLIKFKYLYFDTNIINLIWYKFFSFFLNLSF